MRRTIVLALTLLAITASGARANYLFNKDACQSFVAAQDNFEFCVPGNRTGLADVHNVVAPAGWSFAGKSYNAATNQTCYSFTGPALPQQPATATPYHFGINFNDYNGMEFKDGNEYWSRRTVTSALPGGSCNFNYDQSSNTLTVTVSNDTGAPTSVSQVGIRVFSSPQPLESMTVQQMPPSSFQPSGIPDGTVLNPGDQRSFAVGNVTVTDSAVCFQSVQVVAPPRPPPQPCSQAVSTVRLWAQAPVSQMLPLQAARPAGAASALRATRPRTPRRDIR